MADAECLHALGDDENWFHATQDNGQTVLPIWPDEEFATQARDVTAPDLCVFELPLEDFLTEGVPYLMEADCAAGHLPRTGGRRPVMQGPDFARAINQLLAEWHDAALDLPYLDGCMPAIPGVCITPTSKLIAKNLL